MMASKEAREIIQDILEKLLMPREESLYPADWLRIAEKDLGRVEHLLYVQDPEAAGFFLQQAYDIRWINANG